MIFFLKFLSPLRYIALIISNKLDGDRTVMIIDDPKEEEEKKTEAKEHRSSNDPRLLERDRPWTRTTPVCKRETVLHATPSSPPARRTRIHSHRPNAVITHRAVRL